jgi:undecaprenyl-diphosphatase
MRDVAGFNRMGPRFAVDLAYQAYRLTMSDRLKPFNIPTGRVSWRWLISREGRPIAAFASLAIVLFIAMRFASELAEGEQLALDKIVLLVLRRPDDLAQPIGPAWLQHVMIDMTALGSTSVLTLVVILAVSYLIAIRRRLVALILVASIAGGALLNFLLKVSIARPRPDLVAHLVKETTMSFPSGHSANSAVVYLTLAILLATTQTRSRIRWLIVTCALLITMIIGLSRVYLGVHWPSDVVAGWAVGATWALLCWFVMARFRDRLGV